MPEVGTRELAEVSDAYISLMKTKKHFELALRESEERVRSILTHAGDAFISIDANGLITEWNRQAEETFGWFRQEAIGRSLAELIIPENRREAHSQGMRRFLVTGQGPVINRRQFEEKLEEALARARRTKAAMTVMFLDIDNFKNINDTLGHACGDFVLKEFATRLKNTLRKTDTVARLAGDEFVIILEGLQGVEESRFIAKKIISAIREDFQMNGSMFKVTTSIGIVFDQDSELSQTELTMKADEALYQAKRAGRDSFQLTMA